MERKELLNKIQEIMGGLFASVSAEKFLYELLRESKFKKFLRKLLIMKSWFCLNPWRLLMWMIGIRLHIFN